VTRDHIDSLIKLIKDLGKIFFKLPKLFFQYPPYKPDQTGKSKSKDEINKKIPKDIYGSIMRYVIHEFIEAMIYCSNELLQKE
jgi:hypothetical protein